MPATGSPIEEPPRAVGSTEPPPEASTDERFVTIGDRQIPLVPPPATAEEAWHRARQTSDWIWSGEPRTTPADRDVTPGWEPEFTTHYLSGLVNEVLVRLGSERFLPTFLEAIERGRSAAEDLGFSEEGADRMRAIVDESIVDTTLDIVRDALGAVSSRVTFENATPRLAYPPLGDDHGWSESRVRPTPGPFEM